MVDYTITSNITIILAGMAFSYFVLYKKNKFMGNMAYLLCSLAYLMGVIAIGSTIKDTETIIAIIMTVGSLMSLIYDLVKG